MGACAEARQTTRNTEQVAAVYVNDRTAPLLVAIGALAVMAIALPLARILHRRRT